MQLRVLGCHGGESPTHRATCFIIDDKFLLDAGSMTRGLTIDEQKRVDIAFISHAHLDHIRDLALLADNIFALRKKPVEIYCSEFTADILEKDFFNGRIWPNFLKIPNPTDPDKNGMIRINRIKADTPIEVAGYTVRALKVDHSIECHGFVVRGKDGGTLAYSGDTGPTVHFWEELNKIDDLKAVILEVSFPNNMGEIAKISGHLTPAMVADELQKFKPQKRVPVYLYGMKPGYHEQLKVEVAALKDPRLVMLKPMDQIDL